MIRSIDIKGYRGLDRFVMKDLGRVNLLVGTNNSGKTSVLEALYLWAVEGNPLSLWRLSSDRGEWLEEGAWGRPEDADIDIRHVFHGHELKVGTAFSVTALGGTRGEVQYKIGESDKPDNETQLLLLNDNDTESLETPSDLTLDLEATGSGRRRPLALHVPLTGRGGLSRLALRKTRLRPNEDSSRVMYVTTESHSVSDLLSVWNQISLTDSEEKVLSALRLIEPGIERIATLPSPRGGVDATRGGFLVRLKNSERPVPIGNFGDGIWHILAITTALVGAEGGILLIDEIDTGLHYSVMAGMWKMIAETAKVLDVQVFATTHSRDCVNSLAAICREDVENDSEVTIQRIEREKGRAVAYNEAEIIAAAEHDIEVR